MNEMQSNFGNQPALDFGDEVPYAFGWLPINAELNKAIFERAVERAKRSHERELTK